MDVNFILKYIRTSEEKNELINIIEIMIENNFKNSPSPITGSAYTKMLSEVIYNEINVRKLTNNQEDIDKFLDSIKKLTSSLYEMRMLIPINPSEDLIKKLKAWANENNLPSVIFNLEKKSDIVGGAVIMTHEGEYLDYSLSKQIDKYFIDNKSEITALL